MNHVSEKTAVQDVMLLAKKSINRQMYILHRQMLHITLFMLINAIFFNFLFKNHVAHADDGTPINIKWEGGTIRGTPYFEGAYQKHLFT